MGELPLNGRDPRLPYWHYYEPRCWSFQVYDTTDLDDSGYPSWYGIARVFLESHENGHYYEVFEGYIDGLGSPMTTRYQTLAEIKAKVEQCANFPGRWINSYKENPNA